MRWKYATLEWMDWFNHRRLLEPIDHVPPAEYDTMLHLNGHAKRHDSN